MKLPDAGEGDHLLLLGNEAIVRGAIEAGVKVVTTYPGTPASEIGDSFSALHQKLGVHFEYSVNEKVAYEVAFGACLGGARALTSMKHLGLNVAGDPFVTSAYVGTVAGFVIVSAGEPGCHTSPNEQDHRYFARMAYIPVFDPCSPQEACDMTRMAFELSERWSLPILLRPTTRVCHSQGIVTAGPVREPKENMDFVRDPSRFVPIPRNAKVLRKTLIRRIEAASRDRDCLRFNTLEGSGNELAIVTSGVSSSYVHDAVRELGLTGGVRILKLSIPYPISSGFLLESLRGAAKILVVEELEPFIEDHVKKILFDAGIRVPVLGKHDNVLPLDGEYSPGLVRQAVSFAGSSKKTALPPPDKQAGRERKPDGKAAAAPLPVRPPILCPGCPHRASFFALKLAARPDDIFINDIGCYTLGMAPPFNMGDILLSMGTSITAGGGVSIAVRRKTVAFIGDSTFFHSGITGLINAVINNHDMLLLILDNRVTGMTGHQPSPSFLKAREAPGAGKEEGKSGDASLSIEDICRACGVKNLAVMDPSNPGEALETTKAFHAKDGVSVIVSRHPCPIAFPKPAVEKKVYRVDPDACRVCAQSSGESACGQAPTAAYGLARSVKRIAGCSSISPSREKTPCSASCPAGLCIQGFIAHAQCGDLKAAYRIIRRSLPLAGVIARICPRPCEAGCVRKDHDDAVNINDIKRFVLENTAEKTRKAYLGALLEAAPDHGKKVAVVGSGPAGLAAAWELRLRGYGVTIFEKEKQTGGLLRLAIPRFRLPKDVLDGDIEEILSAGVDIETNAALGRDFSLGDLSGRGFGAVFLATGASKGVRHSIDGSHARGVYDVLEFLRAAGSEEIRELDHGVVVVGGGDAAMDAARTALRLGAASTTVLYRRTPEDMPAGALEIEEAREEGVKFIFQALPEKIVQDHDGVAASVVAVRTEPGRKDASGRASPVPVEGSAFELEARTIIFATGQRLGKEVEAIFGDSGLSSAGFVRVDGAGMETSKKGVFAGGDAVSGPMTVVSAVAAGRRAAWGIDVKLRGEEAVALDPSLQPPEETVDVSAEGVVRKERMLPPKLPAAERSRTMDEVAMTFSRQSMIDEAHRCLACGSCALCSACVTSLGCPAFFITRQGKMQIDANLCNGCGLCEQVCPNMAIAPAGPDAGAREDVEKKECAVVPAIVKSCTFERKWEPPEVLRIHLAGVGGQGTLSSSGVLGEAAKRAGLNVLISALHGMAQRGGMVTNQVIIGDVRSPVIDPGTADVLVGFEPLETVRSLPFGREGCVVLMNTAAVPPFPLTITGKRCPDVETLLPAVCERASLVLTVDALELARKAGNPKAISAVMLGLIAGAGILPFPAEALKDTFLSLSPPSRAEVNARAFDLGLKSAGNRRL